jgi:hypothetical protein
MKAIKRLELRWLLPLVMTTLSASAFWYGTVQDEKTRAALEKQGWHLGAAWHPNSLVEVVGSVNLPAMLAGVLLLNFVHGDSDLRHRFRPLFSSCLGVCGTVGGC